MLTRYLGIVDYAETVAAMQQFTARRLANTEDELWLCEHPPIYTQGITGKAEHLLHTDASIPVITTNRGGQITYHGPGQVVAYPLVDLRRQNYLVREYVHRLEQAVMQTLAQWNIIGQRVANAPGIYVAMPSSINSAPSTNSAETPSPFAGLAKIAALGIKVSNHCTYHGLALNVDMDLSPYRNINPCGYVGLNTVDLHTIGVHIDWCNAAQMLAQNLVLQLVQPTD